MSFCTLTKTAIKHEHNIRLHALKFGTQKGGGGIKVHLGTKFGWNTISSQGVISNYSQKITPIYCHAYRVNRLREEAENQYMDRLTIEPQTFSGLKQIELRLRYSYGQSFKILNTF